MNGGRAFGMPKRICGGPDYLLLKSGGSSQQKDQMGSHPAVDDEAGAPDVQPRGLHELFIENLMTIGRGRSSCSSGKTSQRTQTFCPGHH